MDDRPCYDPETMRRTLEQDGYRPCDCMRCNCNGWHPSANGVGFYARFLELEETIEPRNGESLLKAAKRIKRELDEMNEAAEGRDDI